MMPLIICYALLSFCSICWASNLPLQAQHQQPLLDTSVAIFRPAVEADLDDIITTFIDSFSPGPVWRYGRPYLKQHKHYLWCCMRAEIGAQFKHIPNDTSVNVITVLDPPAPSFVTSRKVRRRAVALAIWKVMTPGALDTSVRSVMTPYLNVQAKCSDHLEANLTRVEDFSRQYEAAEKHYVQDLPRKQLYLGLLATHPSWDGHGFGARHVQWGLDLAKNMSVPVTLLATPAGWPLYDELGFESLANVTIRTLDWEEDIDIWFEYMRHEVK